MLQISRLLSRCMMATAAAGGRHEHILQSCVWSAAWLRQAEVEAARAHNITLYALMQRAGKATFDVCRREYPSSKKWLILCGSGNNGGDGFEIARLAAGADIHVTVVAVKASKAPPPEASAAHAALLKCGGVNIRSADEWSEAEMAAGDFDLVVDGLLGTGIGGAPRADYAELINYVNKLNVPCVAIDIPSGLNAETGAVEGVCIHAEHTVTFIALKPGLLTGKARDYTGQLHYNPLQLDEWMLSRERQNELFCRRLASSHLHELLHQKRRPCAHKGSNGKVVLIGGDAGFGGAIVMAAEAALRTGAGLVRVLTRPQHVPALVCRCPEVMAEELTETSLAEALKWSTCVALGPGLGQSEWGERALEHVLMYAQQHPEKPTVWDADALNIMAAKFSTREGKEEEKESALLCSSARLSNRIITPHPGEAARLLQCSVADVEKDRFSAAKKLAHKYGGVVLLKGPGTVLYTAEEDACVAAGASTSAADSLLSPRCAVADVGNSGMATGGMGDVLTGIIAGLLAQRFNEWSAACIGCIVHGTAADLAAEAQGGTRGLTATSLFKYISTCVNPVK